MKRKINNFLFGKHGAEKVSRMAYFAATLSLSGTQFYVYVRYINTIQTQVSRYVVVVVLALVLVYVDKLR